MIILLIHTDDSEAAPDLKTALGFIWVARDIWFNLGVQLNIGMKELHIIDGNNNDNGWCLQEVLLMWLKSSPSWEQLAMALEEDHVDCADIASEIREKFHIPKTSSISECDVYSYKLIILSNTSPHLNIQSDVE